MTREICIFPLPHRSNRRSSALALLLFACLCLPQSSHAIAPVGLKTEYLQNPRGISTGKPRLSWILEDAAPGAKQSAYQIQAATAPEKLSAGEPDLWDSGKIASDETLGIEYQGAPLASRSSVWWRVKTWCGMGQASAWSEPAFFSAGLLQRADWRAKWISPPIEALRTGNFGYRSATAPSKDDPQWVQIDLGKVSEVDSVRLWGAWPVGGKIPPGDGFPVRFKIETATQNDFSDARVVVDRTAESVANPGAGPLQLDFAPVNAQFVRLTATELSGNWDPEPAWDPAREEFVPSPVDGDWKLALAEMEVLQRGTNLARQRPVTARTSWEDGPKPWSPFGETVWLKANLTDGLTQADPGSGRKHEPVTLFRRIFTPDKAVTKATLYASALGIYEFRLNGEKVGDQQMSPGWTPYQRLVLYQTYDVTPLVKKGTNVLGAMLADGWYRMRGPFDHYNSEKRFAGGGGPRRLLGQLELEYSDGTRQTVATDSSWRCYTNGPIRTATMYDGEYYDSRLDVPDWDRAETLAGNDWQAVVEAPLGQAPHLAAQMLPPIRVLHEVKPVVRTEPKPGVHVYDFGEQLAGVCRIRVDGPSGTAVTLRYAEALQPDGTPYFGNLKGAYNNRDEFILDGSGSQTFMPRFTYHGFRYVQVSGVSPDRVEDLTAVALGSDVQRVTSFSSSDPRLNRLSDIINRAYRSNMQSLVLDVAGRDERLPWLGDCFTDEVQSLAYLYDFAAFGANQLRAIVDASSPEGIPPAHIGGVSGADAVASAGWSDAVVHAAWHLWLSYQDLRTLELGYDASRRFMDVVYKNNPDGIPKNKYLGNFGDWLSSGVTVPPGATAWDPKGQPRMPGELFAAAWWAYSAETVSRMAAALGKKEESDYYAEMARKVREQLIKAHVQPDGKASGDVQSSYALLLGMNLLGNGLRDKAEGQLLQSIRSYQDHLATGSFTTIFLLNYLAESGHQDLAFRMVMQPSFPSYGFMVDNGATAMWERFDGWIPKLGYNPHAMNGLNHPGMNSVYEWILGTVVGIRPDPEQPGYKHFFIEPKPPTGLDWVKASYDSVRGPITVEWKKENGALSLTASVPPNTTATVKLPDDTIKQLGSGRHTLTIPGQRKP